LEGRGKQVDRGKFLNEGQKIKSRVKGRNKERGGVEGGKVGRAKENIRMVFWNVASLKRKEREFWKYIESFDIIGMCETWIEERQWDKLKGNLSKEFSWKCQFAERDKSKGRAKGGIITGIRKEFEELDVKAINVNGVQERRIRVEGGLWRILTVYNGGKMKEMRKKIEETVSELEEERLCIGGDFNARTGREGKKYESGDEKEMRRNSKDRTINSDGKDLLGLTEERGWEIGNGNIRGDEEGEMTYNGARGASVVDCHKPKRGRKDREVNSRGKSRVRSPAFRSGVKRKIREREKENKERV